MSFANSIAIFYRDKPKKSVGGVEIDVARLEDHTYESEVTQYPIETGASVSDFIRNRPERVTIQGFVSNSPVRILGGTLGSLVRGEVPNNAELVFNQLVALHEAREPITIVTGVKTYESMAIERLTIPRDRDTGEAINFTIEAVKIIKAASVLVVLPNIDTTKAGSQGASTTDQGKQTAKTANEQTTQKTSVLKGWFNGAVNFLSR
jgi:hypothetical protein